MFQVWRVIRPLSSRPTFAVMLRGSCVSPSPLSHEIVLFADKDRKTQYKNAIFPQPLKRRCAAVIVHGTVAPLRRFCRFFLFVLPGPPHGIPMAPESVLVTRHGAQKAAP